MRQILERSYHGQLCFPWELAGTRGRRVNHEMRPSSSKTAHFDQSIFSTTAPRTGGKRIPNNLVKEVMRHSDHTFTLTTRQTSGRCTPCAPSASAGARPSARMLRPTRRRKSARDASLLSSFCMLPAPYGLAVKQQVAQTRNNWAFRAIYHVKRRR